MAIGRNNETRIVQKAEQAAMIHVEREIDRE